MPKLDLTRARRLKGPGGEIARLKGAGLLWRKPDLDLPLPVQASGGIETLIEQNGMTYRVHTFLESGTLSVTQDGEVEFLVVGGGGGGGGIDNPDSLANGAGGGAGGVRKFVPGEDYNSDPAPVMLTVGEHDVTIGQGGGPSTGQGINATTAGQDGQPSWVLGIVAAGGGGGAVRNNAQIGGSGGSGGGGARNANGTAAPFGLATGPGLGHDGGPAIPDFFAGAGGGGAGGPGGDSEFCAGGVGVPTAIDGILRHYAGGGGGGPRLFIGSSPGGLGGGGNGGAATAGAPNTGGGGGGGQPGPGKPGGSGIVILRYPIGPVDTEARMRLQNTMAPVIWGNTVPGSMLTATSGTWDPLP